MLEFAKCSHLSMLNNIDALQLLLFSQIFNGSRTILHISYKKADTVVSACFT